MVQETEVVDIDEHMKVHEAIVPGPHGQQVVVLAVEDDIRIHEEIKKNEVVDEGRHTRSTESSSPLGLINAGAGAGAASPSSHSKHHFLEHKA